MRVLKEEKVKLGYTVLGTNGQLTMAFEKTVEGGKKRDRRRLKLLDDMK